MLHAASQDLPCLVEIGLRPTRLFDTELAARLANVERVGPGRADREPARLRAGEAPLGGRLVDPAAAAVVAQLRRARRGAAGRPARAVGPGAVATGQARVGREEFAALVASAGRPRRPYARTRGGARRVSTRSVARGRCPGCGRCGTPGTASRAPRHRTRPGPARRRDRRRRRPAIRATRWSCWPCPASAAVRCAGSRRSGSTRWPRRAACPTPTCRQPTQPDGPPPPHRWAERDPIAAERLARCREVVTRIAGEHNLPPENLVAPDAIRRLAWTPPGEITPSTVTQALTATGVRRWQSTLLADELARALPDPPTPPPSTED